MSHAITVGDLLVVGAIAVAIVAGVYWFILALWKQP